MSDRLLPTGSSPLEVAAAEACADIEKMPVPLRQLWNAQTCPVALLPYLAWAWSVDRWDSGWNEATKRSVVAASEYVHRHKGTIGSLRRIVEPLGYLIRITEWWKTGEAPGTFRLDVGVLDTGITEAMYNELERLIADAKPCSRHLTGLSVNLDSSGTLPVAAASYSGDELTVYPYTPEIITVSGPGYTGTAVHLIDLTEVRT
ncbi:MULTISPECIES: phage tail protein I [Pantoea]|jgi:phage tail P2-like protein|uniref:Phage tail protein I n=1 Tax=Pantoea piersonii TaxID=2364647 RepID=A0AAJ5QLW9_9GAMM|nr:MULTISPECIES: phage tail protein I [Pantoea]MDU6433529.1 phage tail protein I [Pantoea sp.]MBZ6387223.1 phage tail protein I [Pantoea piersonii]MBZ6402177.1 phage tail protein I [Pantoea piersonii]MBZ6409667.1 phage tail protein I [Pantoea piersonii]MBZ6426713.1 phage tail protein I [Pantoea piersonii]